MSRCISAAPFLSTHSKTKFNGLAFDSGYPGNLTHHFGSDNRDSSSYKFTEFKLDLSLATHNNGGKLVRRCYGGLLKRCDDVENFQAEYMVRGGDIQPVQGLYGQYESVLQVLRIKDNQVTAERRVSLFGGGVLGIYFGFFGQSQYLACNAGETNTYWWFGGGQQADGHEQNEKLEKRDVQFILSFVEYEP